MVEGTVNSFWSGELWRQGRPWVILGCLICDSLLADSAFLPACSFHVKREEKVCDVGRAGKDLKPFFPLSCHGPSFNFQVFQSPHLKIIS